MGRHMLTGACLALFLVHSSLQRKWCKNSNITIKSHPRLSQHYSLRVIKETETQAFAQQFQPEVRLMSSGRQVSDCNILRSEFASKKR